MSVSVDALQTKMQDALTFDQRKTQINDAKLRAVAQKVEYDEFEKMVAGAHLKPVKPCSKESADISKQFSGFVMPAYAPQAAHAASKPAPAIEAAATAFAAPATSNEFLRTWRRQCKAPEAKYRYLRVIEPESLPLLFRSEMEPAVLDGIAQALQQCVLGPHAAADDAAELQEDVAWMEQLLLYLRRINRFELTLDLADSQTTKTLAACFDLLQRSAAAPPKGRLDEAGLRKVREGYKL